MTVPVMRCLQAIRFILPKDTAMKVLVKWYNIYNAPGGPSMHLEWNLFVTCFMTLMGYNTDRLTWTRNVSDVQNNSNSNNNSNNNITASVTVLNVCYVITG